MSDIKIGLVPGTKLYYIGNGAYTGKAGYEMFLEKLKEEAENYPSGIRQQIEDIPIAEYNKTLTKKELKEILEDIQNDKYPKIIVKDPFKF